MYITYRSRVVQFESVFFPGKQKGYFPVGFFDQFRKKNLCLFYFDVLSFLMYIQYGFDNACQFADLHFPCLQ